MRSNKSGATRFLLKSNLFIGVIVFIATFFVLPFWGLAHLSNDKASIMTMIDPAPSLTRLVSTSVFTSPLQLEPMVILYGGLGFMTAMMLLRHLFSRRQGLLHAALPDRRQSDLLRRVAAYGVLCLAPIVVNFVLYLLTVAFNGLLPYVAWSKLLPKFGLLLLINLYGFAMGMLASVLTGTYWAALLAGAVLILGMEGMLYVWHGLAEHYLHTLVGENFTKQLVYLSPAASLCKGAYRPELFVWLPGTIAIIAAFALSFLLYRVRKTEAAEHTLAFRPLHFVMGFLLPLLGGTVVGAITYLSFVTEAALVAGMVLGAVFTFWLCRIVFNRRMCGILQQWYLPAAAALVLVLGVVALHTDVMGFDHYLPAREEVTAISYQPRAYLADEHITLTSPAALDAAHDWCTLMRDETDGFANGIDASAQAASSSSVVVTYHLGDRTVSRCYPNGKAVRNAAQESLTAILESDDYRRSMVDAYHLESEHVTNLYLNSRTEALRSDKLYETFGLYAGYIALDRHTSGDTIDTWLSAIRTDVLTRTFEEKTADPLFSLELSVEDPQNNQYVYHSLPIYPGDVNFLQAVFGDKAQQLIDYGTGGYADVLALQVTYAMSRGELRALDVPERDVVTAVTVAATPQQAVEWVRSAQSSSIERYYYMPCYEDSSYSRLYLYRLSEVEKLQPMNGYAIPADRAQFYHQQQIPVTSILNFVGK